MRADKSGDPVGHGDGDDLLRMTEELERRNAALEAQLQEQDRNRATLLHLLEELERERSIIEEGRREWVTSLDAVRDPIFIHDKDMKVVRANRAYAALAGLDIREVIGKPYWQVFPKLGGPLPGCRRAMEEHAEQEEEIRLDERDYIARSYPIYDAEKNYLHSLHILQDITERRQAEAEQRVLSEAMRQAAEAVLVLDAEARIAYLNPSFYRLFGYAPEEILGKPIMSLSVPGDDEAHQPAAVVAALREREQWKGEVRRRARDGTAIPVLLSASVIRDDKGKITGYVGTFLDLREIKRAEQALKDSEQRLRDIVEHSTNMFYSHTPEHVLTYVSPQVWQFLDCEPEEALVRWTEFVTDNPVNARGYELTQRAIDSRERQPVYELELIGKRGRKVWVEVDEAPVVRDGMTVAIVGALTDITGRKLAEEALGRANRALKTLSAGNAALVHAQSESELLWQICRVIVKTGGYAYAWIGYGANDAEKRIRPMAQEGFEPGFLEAQPWPVQGQNPSSIAVREGVAVVVHDTANDPALAERHDMIVRLGVGSIASFPLMSGDEAFGMLSIYSRERDAFDRDELMLLAEMAEDLNFGILTLCARVEHERLQEEHLKTAERLKETLADTIRAIALTVEKRDPYTAGHQNKVAELCVAIGRELGLDANRLEGLRLGATIHDIGKVYIPAEILNRPGKLTDPEFEIIKSHPEVGYDIVKDVKFPWPVGEMILQHHERMDGSGYPKGLKGEDILLEARIMAVADTVEAMSSHRPYRPALGFEKALAEIEQNRGITYDAVVVDTCLKLFKEKGFNFSP